MASTITAKTRNSDDSNFRCIKYVSTMYAFTDAINKAIATVSADRLIQVTVMVMNVKVSKVISTQAWVR